MLGCGGNEIAEERARPEWRALITRALDQAMRDSIRLAASGFQADASMTMEFGRDGARVAVDDKFRLLKTSGGGFSTEPVAHLVRGDTTLLNDMYTFRTSKGEARSQERAELGGLSFGADFPTLLRALLHEEEAGYTLRDSAAIVNGGPCHLFSYTTAERQGRFWVGGDSLDLVRLEMEQESDFLVGGYSYTMSTEFGRQPGGVLLPVRTISRFEYSRLSTDGTGTITVVLDSVRTR